MKNKPGRPFEDNPKDKQIRVSHKLYFALMAQAVDHESIGATLERLFFEPVNEKRLTMIKQLDSIVHLLQKIKQ